MDFRQTCLQIQEQSMRANRIGIVLHKNPDGDTLGSGTAIYHWLKQKEKDVFLFCVDAPEPGLCFIPGSTDVQTDPTLILNEKADLLIAVDGASPDYNGLEKLLAQTNRKPTIINIDHHQTNKGYGDLNLVIPDADATADIVARMLIELDVPLTPDIATCCLTGILTDTSHFSNAATTKTGMETAGHLIKAGARMTQINRKILQTKTLSTLRLWGRALDHLQHVPEKQMVVTYITQEDLKACDANEESTAGISNFLNETCGSADIILVFTEQKDGTLKGSLRSIKTDVAAIAKKLGGGGHIRAAGFSVNGKIEKTKKGFRIKTV